MKITVILLLIVHVMVVLSFRSAKFPNSPRKLSANLYSLEGFFSSVLLFPNARNLSTSVNEKTTIISSSGLTEYIGLTEKGNQQRWAADRLIFVKQTPSQLWKTKFNLWRQYPWKKINGKTILKLKLRGELQIDSAAAGFSLGSARDFEYVDSLSGVTKLLTYGALDPRVVGILIDISSLTCGYAKLRELRRYMDYFTQSGKELIGYCTSGSEKELYVAMGCTKFYVPPDGMLDLRGFTSGAAFLRGVFDKIGVEPQVQRIGKYKSFGDTFNRTTISDAQREVISSLLLEGSDYWADNIVEKLNRPTLPDTTTTTAATADSAASTTNTPESTATTTSTKASNNFTKIEIMKQLWESDGIKTPYELKRIGILTGVNYLDEVENQFKAQLRAPEKRLGSFFTAWLSSKNTANETNAATISDFSLTEDFLQSPRRQITNLNHQNLSTNSTDTGDKQWRIIEETNVLPENYVTIATKLDSEGDPSTQTGTKGDAGVDAESAGAAEKSKDKEKSLKEEEARKAALKRREPRFTPASLYLRKMRKGDRVIDGLPVKETFSGPRIAIINAVGGIATGVSSKGSSRSIGSDTVIAQLRSLQDDAGVKAVVLRIDSPGGSALASDLMWREIRVLSRSKPVIASMVDVAASGGYYMAMACDYIVAEDMTITGSIGVVYSKFNAKELFRKIGYNVEVLSRGRFAEVRVFDSLVLLAWCD